MQQLTDIAYVRALLERHGFRFSKSLGQNFLINPTVCPRIAALGHAQPGYGILEIGTGVGTLTAELAADFDTRIAEKETELAGINRNAAAIREEIAAISKSKLELEGKRTRADKDAQARNAEILDLERRSARIEQKKLAADLVSHVTVPTFHRAV